AVPTPPPPLFRPMGGAIGAPILGAIFANKLQAALLSRLPPQVPERLPGKLGPSQIDQLPPAIRQPYIEAWAAALRPIFLLAAGIAAFGFLLTWFLQEKPL